MRPIFPTALRGPHDLRRAARLMAVAACLAAALVPARANAVCGDGALEISEACDDGNTRSGDGCSATCVEETGYVCNRVGLVRNISFEAPVIPLTPNPYLRQLPTSWNAIAGLDLVDIHRTTNTGQGVAPDGMQLVDLNSSALGGMSQDLTTVAGNTYSLQFFGAINNNCSSTATGRFRAINAGADLTNITLTSTVSFNSPASQWEQIQLRFTAASATTQLQLTTVTPNGACGFVVDGLSQLTTICSRTCGNGSIQQGEACDDGNNMNGDGCNARCLKETGQTCESGADCTTGSCLTGTNGAQTCGLCQDTAGPGGNDQGCGGVRPICNVGATPRTCVGCLATADCRTGFTCDTTTNLCVRCGDGRVTGSEQCDDGGILPGDGCSALCTTEPGFTCPAAGGMCSRTCPNGMLNIGESCDDNNSTNGDGCSSLCLQELNFTCTGAPSVCAPAVAITTPANGSAVSMRRPPISGTAPAGATVTVTLNGGTAVMVTANALGVWTLTPSADLPLGNNTATATVTVGGRTGNAMTMFTVRCATNAECSGATPVCSLTGATMGTCVGCASGTVFDPVASMCTAPRVALTNPPAGTTTPTTNVRPTFTGTGVPGQTVTVTADGAMQCTATVTNAGTWSCTGTTDLALGMRVIAATSAGAMSMGTLEVRCTMSSQCGNGQVCNVTSGACVTPACRGNASAGSAADCPEATPVCNDPGTPTAVCAACAVGEVYNPTALACATLTVSLTNPPANGTANTTMTRPTIEGTGVPGQMVSVTSGATALCMTVVTATGTWSCASGVDLPLGSNTITATSGTATSMGTLEVRCTMSSQCAGATPVCDVATGACVAAPPTDAGVPTDAGMGTDAGTDAGTSTDAGVTTDAGTNMDAGRDAGADAGRGSLTGDGACGCSTPGRASDGDARGLAAIALALATSSALVARRRRRDARNA